MNTHCLLIKIKQQETKTMHKILSFVFQACITHTSNYQYCLKNTNSWRKAVDGLPYHLTSTARDWEWGAGGLSKDGKIWARRLHSKVTSLALPELCCQVTCLPTYKFMLHIQVIYMIYKAHNILHTHREAQTYIIHIKCIY